MGVLAVSTMMMFLLWLIVSYFGGAVLFGGGSDQGLAVAAGNHVFLLSTVFLGPSLYFICVRHRTFKG